MKNFTSFPSQPGPTREMLAVFDAPGPSKALQFNVLFYYFSRLRIKVLVKWLNLPHSN